MSKLQGSVVVLQSMRLGLENADCLPSWVSSIGFASDDAGGTLMPCHPNDSPEASLVPRTLDALWELLKGCIGMAGRGYLLSSIE